MYQNFTVGYGGACSVYDPPVSPWCSEDFYLVRQFGGGGAMHTRMPAGKALWLSIVYLYWNLLCFCAGVEAEAHLPNSPYKHAEGAHVFAWRPGHWYTWCVFSCSRDLARVTLLS